MTLIYLAGIISGVVLAIIVLTSWIVAASKKIRGASDTPGEANGKGAYTGNPPVEIHRARGYRRRARTDPFVA